MKFKNFALTMAFSAGFFSCGSNLSQNSLSTSKNKIKDGSDSEKNLMSDIEVEDLKASVKGFIPTALEGIPDVNMNTGTVDLLFSGSAFGLYHLNKASLYFYEQGMQYNPHQPPMVFILLTDSEGQVLSRSEVRYLYSSEKDGVAGWVENNKIKKEMATWAAKDKKTSDVLRIEFGEGTTEGDDNVYAAFSRYFPESFNAHLYNFKGNRRIFRELQQFVTDEKQAVSKSSPYYSVLKYADNELPHIQHYLKHGFLEIDNNLAENAIRPFALGRRNWLFIIGEKGAKASANIYSLLMTAKANNIEPIEYLTNIIRNLPYCETLEDYESLLPK